MMEELVKFLRESRNVEEEFVKKIMDEKIDCETLNGMSDADLKPYIPKFGDRFATRKFCTENLAKKDGGKHKLLQKLRKSFKQKLSNKSRECNENDDEDGESNDKRRKKLVGNGNATRENRKIEIGWLDFQHSRQKFQQVRYKNGGGTRDVKAKKTWRINDILQQGKKLFFPYGKSTKGFESEFEFAVKDFAKSDIEDISVEEIYEKTGAKMLRFYMCTTRKDKQDVETNEEKEFDSDSSLYDPKLKGPSETSKIDIDEPSNACGENLDGPENENSLAAESISTNSNVLESLQTGLIDTHDMNADSKYPENPESMLVVGDDSVVTLASDMDENSGLIQFAFQLTQQELQSEKLDEYQVDEEIFFGPIPDTVPDMSHDVTISTEDIHVLEMDIRVRQGNVFAELLHLFLTEGRTLGNGVSVKRVLPNGQEEAGVGIGLIRDIFTEFWESFYLKCSEGYTVKIPILRHDMGEAEWLAVGRIICDGWNVCGYFAIQLARQVFEKAIDGSFTTSLKSTFLDIIPPSEKSVLEMALKNFSEVDIEELMDVLEAHDGKRLPTADNIEQIVYEFAHIEIIQNTSYVVECWTKIFSKNLAINKLSLSNIYQEKQPTVRKLLNTLSFPSSMDDSEKATANHLKRFIRGLDNREIESFLRFCTGSNVMTGDITVEFNRLSGFARRPTAHTCSNILKLPSTHDSFSDFREEFKNILTSKVWEMGYV